MPNLPSELVEDILRRLPVKSLKRFRAVAKKWRSLIDSDRFVKLHLRHSLASLSNRHLITGGVGVCTVALDSLDKAEYVIPPFRFNGSEEISHSCNGVVLVMSQPPVLWNPFSRDYKILPDCPVESAAPANSYSKTGYEFGYDARNDDYKVIRVSDFRHKITHASIANETKIYSLKTNSWRRIDPLPSPPPYLQLNWRVHLNGAVHTLVEDPENANGARIMCFSLETETLRPMKMPSGINVRDFVVSLDVTGDFLSVVCSNKKRVVIWVMKEYGVADSWAKLLSVSSHSYQRSDYVKPLVYSRRGDRVLLSCNDKRLVWYDLRKKSVRDVCVDGLPVVFYAEACVESLVSLDGGRGGIKNLGQDKEKIRKKRDDFLSKGFKLVL
ncbi:hypothetical protein ACP275_08G159000 [Erythranthe tilingii]